MGGLARKAQYTSTTRKDAGSSRTVLVLDAGDLLFPEEQLFPEEVDQRRIKAELIAAANQAIANDAMAVGDQDLRLGVEFLKTLATTHQLPMINANIVSTLDGKTVFPPHVIKNACGAKIGIFSVIAALGGDGKPMVAGPNYRVEDPFETAIREVRALEAEGVQAIIAVTHLGLQDDLRLAREVPKINLIFGGHTMSQLVEPQKIGTTWVFQSGFKGKHLGRVDIDLSGPVPEAIVAIADMSNGERVRQRIATYEERITEIKGRLEAEADADRKTMLQDQVAFYEEQLLLEKKDLPKEGSASSLKNQLVELSREIPDEPKVAALVGAALEKMAAMPKPEYQIPPTIVMKGVEGSPFVGAAVCQGCHVKEYETWASTQHAKAFRTLIDENHNLDFDCVSCHTTGYRKDGGPKDPFTVGGMINVQCEVCHGPGRTHATEPQKVEMKIAFTESDCRGCHSEEQTGDRFVFGQYLPKVDHGKSAAATKPPGKKAAKKSP